MKLDFQDVRRVLEDPVDLGGTTRVDESVDALEEIHSNKNNFPAPTLIADTVFPERSPCEWRVRFHGVANETARGVCEKTEVEYYEEVVNIPESLVRLPADFDVSRSVHQKHAKKHDVPCDASSLCVMNLDSPNWAKP